MYPRIVFIFIILLISNSSFPCSCHTDIEEMNIARYNDAYSIFIGTADSIGDCEKTRTVSFKINKLYKGIEQDKIMVEGIDCKTSCALSFEKNQEYLVYLYKDADNKLRIYPCTGTRKTISKEEKAQELKQAEKFNTLYYLKKEIEIWEHEIEFLEKILPVKDGKVKTYYPNGELTGEGKFDKGIPVGSWKYFYPDGNIKSSGSYLNGLKTGIWVENSTYYATYEDTLGAPRKRYLLKNTGTYLNGLKEGKWERVNIDGSK
jgi:antitoxin component YwqK of YwqJK toxin-antitoxin module